MTTRAGDNQAAYQPGHLTVGVASGKQAGPESYGRMGTERGKSRPILHRLALTTTDTALTRPLRGRVLVAMCPWLR